MFFNSNPYYDPFADPNRGIFGIGSAPGRVGFFSQSGYNPYMPPTPPSPPQRVDSPTLNSTTPQLNNTTTGGAGGGTGGGAGSDDQTTQGYGILPWLGVGLYGLNTLGNLYFGHEALNQAWAQFRFQREMANQNLAASIQAYNDAQRRRLRGRSGAFSEEDIDRMMEGRELKDTRKYK